QMTDLLNAIVENSGVNLQEFQILSEFMGVDDPANFLHDQFMDTYTTEADGFFMFSHCDDETTNQAPSLNGFPLDCPRPEAEQQGNIDAWFPVSIFNRFDLTPTDGANCGEQRIVMANNTAIGGSRFFLIFEAQIPNPDPGGSLEACAPIATFWAEQASITDPVERGERLRQAFLEGSEPSLESAGFGAFMSAENFTDETGHIRSNNFNNFTWSLREHTLTIFENLIVSQMVPVTNNVFGELWNDNQQHTKGQFCRELILESVEALSSDDPSDWALTTHEDCWAAESEFSIANNYLAQFSSSSSDFASEIEDRISGNLSATDIVGRAEFVGSCMGCHQNATGLNLGNGQIAPQSLGFVHASEFPTTCDDGSETCFMLSPALTDVFLPERLETITEFLTLHEEGISKIASSDMEGVLLEMEVKRKTIGGQSLSRIH
ncbi:MAG: hypothetical protein VX278_22715, partial [Myxococcota bacterium]|nr:hypothetical protein [Myxococcota bacterium]